MNFPDTTKLLAKITRIYVLIFILLCYSSSVAQVSNKKIIYPLMGSISLSIGSGFIIPFTDYDRPQLGFIWKGSAGYYFKTYTNHFVGIKLFGGTGNFGGEDLNRSTSEFKTHISFFGVGVNYGYRIGEYFYPNFFAGISYLHFNPEDKNGKKLSKNYAGIYNNNDVNLNFEIGLQYLFTDQMALDFNTGLVLNFNDWLDDSRTGNDNDIFISVMIGINYYLMADKDSDNDGVADTKDACPNTPINVTVNQFGCPIDSDHDNVPDYIDQCPNTPSGVTVDSNGCPIDSDSDGVPDYADRCSGTIQGLKVNRYGCPIDMDRDGIPDYLDRCPRTPFGVAIDSLGCPVDSDRDLIPDYIDQCPNTPDSIQVDNFGCPIDSDKDGIPDYLDKCPDTAPNTKVTVDGCLDDFYKYIFNAETLFKSGKAILSAQAYKELDKVVEKIKLRPTANWRIEGYTDNVGSKEYNKTLSLLRAQSVYNYFVAKGLDKDRFEVVGMGEDFPIKDNKTAEGRRINRRVVLIRVEK